MNEFENNYNWLKKFTLSEGASIFGVADITGKKDHIRIYPPGLLKNFNRAISVGYHLSDMVFETLVDRPNSLYHRHYKMANTYLDLLAMKIGEQIQRRNYNYIPIPASQVLDWEGLSSQASHRAIAVLAGIGWRGRSSLLVTPQFGARVRLVSVLTDMPLKADRPIEGNCGECRMCMDMCPAGAITVERYDLKACHELLKHFARTLCTSLICGICQKACGKKTIHQAIFP